MFEFWKLLLQIIVEALGLLKLHNLPFHISLGLLFFVHRNSKTFELIFEICKFFKCLFHLSGELFVLFLQIGDLVFFLIKDVFLIFGKTT